MEEKRFKIISAGSLPKLENSINELLVLGYSLVGNITVIIESTDTAVFSQSMIKLPMR